MFRLPPNRARIFRAFAGLDEPDAADVQQETDKIVTQLHSIIQIFGGVPGGIIWENSR
jgi:hypothetical protein